MRSTRKPRADEFQSFEIVITVTSEEEAQALYAIFNYVPNTDLFPHDGSDCIKQAIGEAYSVSGVDDVIANGVTYRQFYSITKRRGK